MLTDEWLSEHADRINDLVARAEDVDGDSSAILGTLVIMAMDETEYKTFTDAATSDEDFVAIYQQVEARFDAAGIEMDEQV